MQKNYLLSDKLAVKLYDKVVKDLPIIDYHNHLNFKNIADNASFDNITQLWVSSDPYKHRAMRILGVDEKFITGDSSDYEKFEAWYNSLKDLMGNPLFDWSILELKKVFNYELLPFQDAKIVWNILNEKLKTLKTNDILSVFNIEYSAPCASIVDDISVYDKTKNYAPSLRGDDFLLPTKDFILKLSSVSNNPINSIDDFFKSIEIRLGDFKRVGAIFSDHALDNGFKYLKDDGKNSDRFNAILNGEELSNEDKINVKSFILCNVAILYSKLKFSMQLHIGAERFTSTKLRNAVGPAGGFAGIGSTVDVKSLTAFLDDVDLSYYGLPKTVLFTLNPSDNAVMATLSGSYSKGGTIGLVTQGPAWWWCDHYEGIMEMLTNFISHSVLSTFIGMTTDSRSILSFVRHDYFRRIVCSFISNNVKIGRIPNDYKLLEDLAKKICYLNAKDLIGE